MAQIDAVKQIPTDLTRLQTWPITPQQSFVLLQDPVSLVNVEIVWTDGVPVSRDSELKLAGLFWSQTITSCD